MGLLAHLIGNRLVHGLGRMTAGWTADNPGRNARNGALGGHIFQHDTAGRNLGFVTDMDIAQNLGADRKQDTLADLRMAVADFLACTAQCHTVQERTIVANNRCFTNRDAGRMVQHDAGTDASGGVNLVSMESGEAFRSARNPLK